MGPLQTTSGVSPRTASGRATTNATVPVGKATGVPAGETVCRAQVRQPRVDRRHLALRDGPPVGVFACRDHLPSGEEAVISVTRGTATAEG